jgi:lactoylglutathione lyase
MLKKAILSSLLFSSILCGTSVISFAQPAPIANHVALYVVDLAKSADFYKNVMLLKEIPEPFHDGKHVWLKTGEHSQLHLIQGAASVKEQDINSHFAYSVKSLQEFTKHLDKVHYKYGNWKGDSQSPQLRPDGIKQVYLQDPDNVWIEVNDDKF